MSARAMVSTHLVQGDGWWDREPRRRRPGAFRRAALAWRTRRAGGAERPVEAAGPLGPVGPVVAQQPPEPVQALVPEPRHRLDVVDLREDERWAALADEAGDLVTSGGPRHRR